MCKKKGIKNQDGLSYIEVLVAITILTIGIVAQLSALTFTIVRARETEQRNAARQITSSTIESIFAARDLGNINGLNNWESVHMTNESPDGVFIPGWQEIRENLGQDGIIGTADDACSPNPVCKSGNYTNDSPIVSGFERKITITDINEEGSTIVRKRRVEVTVRYYVGQLLREETLATVIADLPFYN